MKIDKGFVCGYLRRHRRRVAAAIAILAVGIVLAFAYYGHVPAQVLAVLAGILFAASVLYRPLEPGPPHRVANSVYVAGAVCAGMAFAETWPVSRPLRADMMLLSVVVFGFLLVVWSPGEASYFREMLRVVKPPDGESKNGESGEDDGDGEKGEGEEDDGDGEANGNADGEES